FIVLLGAGLGVFGVWALLLCAGLGFYLTIFGLAAVFLFAGANVLPTRNNNKKYIDTQLADACADMERYLNSYEGNFPVPACYAHPITLRRMKRLVLEGKAEKMDEAFEKMKEELKALNSDVKVEQEEYDEVVTIKPMFLVKNYE
ncbi:MAG: ATPase P, partial [Lachnospiraceae bacterium]|nr:ATPase P [Lachnospiraceae bacterium]